MPKLASPGAESGLQQGCDAGHDQGGADDVASGRVVLGHTGQRGHHQRHRHAPVQKRQELLRRGNAVTWRQSTLCIYVNCLSLFMIL